MEEREKTTHSAIVEKQSFLLRVELWKHHI